MPDTFQLDYEHPDFNAKAPRYKSAQAILGCAEFKAGAFVSISYHEERDGRPWFKIERHDKGACRVPVYYPAHHLDGYVL